MNIFAYEKIKMFPCLMGDIQSQNWLITKEVVKVHGMGIMSFQAGPLCDMMCKKVWMRGYNRKNQINFGNG